MLKNQEDLLLKDDEFDIKSFLFKIIQYWKLFLFTIPLSLAIVYLINLTKEPLYKVSTSILIKDEY